MGCLAAACADSVVISSSFLSDAAVKGGALGVTNSSLVGDNVGLAVREWTETGEVGLVDGFDTGLVAIGLYVASAIGSCVVTIGSDMGNDEVIAPMLTGDWVGAVKTKFEFSATPLVLFLRNGRPTKSKVASIMVSKKHKIASL